ncbi:MAG: HEAT repeat domain-containing protein [Ardenticatenaceae bacterium]
MSVVWGQAASESLFLKRLGVEYLPLMFIADALLTMVAIIIYGAFVDRISNMKLMIAISVLGALLLGVARFGLLFDLTLVYSLLYLLERTLRALISIHAWTYIADFYDTGTAKRHFALIASASRPSGILAGLLVLPLVRFGGTENLLFAWIGVLLLSAWLAWMTPRQVSLIAPLDESKESSPKGSYREGFRYVASSSFLRHLALAAIVGTILLYLLDYQSQRIFVDHFESSEELASFYGLLGAFSDFLILPIQMVLLSRLITRFGVAKANLIFPSLTALSYMLLTLLPSLASAAFARMDRTALRSAFRTPIDGLLYNAVPLAIKGRARAFINGLLVPVGSLLAGFILLAVSFHWIEVWQVTIFGLTMVAIYIIVSVRTRFEYTNSLVTLLTEDEMSLFRLSESDTGFQQNDPATLLLIQQRLERSTDDDLTIFLAEMLCEIQGPDALDHLQLLAVRRSPQVQAALISLMGAYWGSSVYRFCLRALNSQQAIVRLASATVLADNSRTYKDKRLLEAFRERLNDPDERVQATVIPPLMASGDFYYLTPAVEHLSKWLDPGSSIHHRTQGLRVLALSNNEYLLPSLVRYLNDPEPLVRRQVVELIDQIVRQTQIEKVRQSALKTVRRQLSDADESVRLAAVRALGHAGREEANRALLIALKDPSFIVRAQACAVITPVPELEEMLYAQNGYQAESAAYVLASRPRIKRRILELIEQLITDVYTLHKQRLTLSRLNTPSVQLLKDTLQEEADQLLGRAFWLLAALSDAQKAQAIQQALQSQNPLTRANGVETLESLASPRLSRLITPLFDGTSLSDYMQIGDKMLRLPQQNIQTLFGQAWPQLRMGDSPTQAWRSAISFNLRPLYEDGWLTALVIWIISETDMMLLNHGLGQPFFFNKDLFLSALQDTLNNASSELVLETAALVFSRMNRREYVNYS